MCGGFGTRIRGVSEDLPKPMIPIGGYPILWHIMKTYSFYGHRKFILCLGYKAWDIKEFFIRYKSMVSDIKVLTASDSISPVSEDQVDDWEVTLVDTGINSGTGGRLAKVAHLIDTDHFMLSYGDGVGNIDLSAQLANLATSDYLGLVTGVHPTSRYGELSVSDGQVTSFAEKIESNGWVSGGFFAFKSDFLEYVPQDEPAHFFEHGPLQKLAAEGKLGLFPHGGFWMGMDTFREYSSLNAMWEQNEATWKVWGSESPDVVLS